MIYVSSDTDIWQDVYCLSILEPAFRLQDSYIIYKEVLNQTAQELMTYLQALGVSGTELTIEEFSYADSIGREYIYLSANERIALAIAKMRNITLLIGNSQLRRAAEKEGIKVVDKDVLLNHLLRESYSA